MTFPGTARRDDEDRAEATASLLAQARETSDEVERRRLLDEVVVLNMRVAESLVWRFRSRGVPTEDLQQVAYLALTKSVHRFDPTVGPDFLAFCVPTIRGELRRYFRDKGWVVRPPRGIQELQPEVSRANEDLWRVLGRSPTPGEVAAHIGHSEEAVLEALSARGCFSPSSLDKPVRVGEESIPLGHLLSAEDASQDGAEARVMLQPIVRSLSERDRSILHMRFFLGLTQREIANEIGVTQMQVSRLLTRIYADLRTALGDVRGPAA